MPAPLPLIFSLFVIYIFSIYAYRLFTLWPFWDAPPAVKKREAVLYLLMWAGISGCLGLLLYFCFKGIIWGIFPAFILLPLMPAAAFQWNARFRPALDAREVALFAKKLALLPNEAPDYTFSGRGCFLWKGALYTFREMDYIPVKFGEKIYRRNRAWFSFPFSYPDGCPAEGLALFCIKGKSLYFLDFSPCFKKYRPALSLKEDSSPQNMKAWKDYCRRLYAANQVKPIDALGIFFYINNWVSGTEAPPLCLFPRKVKVF